MDRQIALWMEAVKKARAGRVQLLTDNEREKFAGVSSVAVISKLEGLEPDIRVFVEGINPNNGRVIYFGKDWRRTSRPLEELGYALNSIDGSAKYLSTAG